MELTGVQIGILTIVLALGLMFLGIPIAVTMLMAGFVGMWAVRGWVPALTALGYIPWRQGVNIILVVIPLYTWMGVLASKGQVGRDAFTALYKWVGQLRGGLAMAVSAASAAFGAVCGNHIATAVAMDKVAFAEMKKRNYDVEFSLGTIAASGNLGIIIPPSGAFILYGFLTQTSIAKLFISGILPGIFATVLFCIQIAIQCRLKPSLAPAGPGVGWIDRLKNTYLLWPIALVFLIVMGGIYTGVFTPTEAASWGCLALIVVGIAKRTLNVKSIIQSLQETMPISAFIMLMLIGGWVFGAALATSGLPKALTSLIAASGLNHYLILGLILVIYLIAGCLMDIYAVLIVTLPIFFPIVSGLGFGPLHFGVLCVLCVMAGSISPPFGILVFALHGIHKDVPIYTLFRNVIPFLISLIVCIFVIMFVPQIATFLPSH
jgi:C4-dicarboxylate transporter, DctM subunit